MCHLADVSRASYYRHLEEAAPEEAEMATRTAIGWSLDRTLAARIAVAALKQAIAQRQPPSGVVIHSDQGIQFASAEFNEVTQTHRMIPSMSRPPVRVS